jgi:hypothetical protein
LPGVHRVFLACFGINPKLISLLLGSREFRAKTCHRLPVICRKIRLEALLKTLNFTAISLCQIALLFSFY